MRKGDKKSGDGHWYYDEAFIAVVMHYLHYMLEVVFSNPKNIQVLGMHQEQGDKVIVIIYI